MLIPDAAASFRSRRIARNSLPKPAKMISIIKARTASLITSFMVIPRTLPQSRESAPLPIAVLGARLMKIRPRAIISGKIAPMIVSARSLESSERGPRTAAVPTANRIAIHKGSTAATANPNAAPAKAAWDMANPSEDRFIRTTNTPIWLHSIPLRRLPNKVGRTM